MRIGELLLQRGWVDADTLERIAAEQRPGGPRLCSLLIGRGALEPDHASRALGDQRGVAAALQKHLAYRDRTLAPLLPARVARAAVALPIGRVRDGSLIVCTRDPVPDVAAAIRRVVIGAVTLAIAPATQLEQLVARMYPPGQTGPQVPDPAEGGPGTARLPTADGVPEESFDVDLRTGPIPLLDDLANLEGLTLVGLDDTRVSRDPSQSPTYTPPSTARKGPAVIPIEATCAAIAAAATRDDMTDLAMRFAASRFTASLLLTVQEQVALGHRGHGAALTPEIVAAITVPLHTPSLVKTAYEQGRASDARPGVIQDRLVRLLGSPRTPLAAAIRVGAHVACVLVVGDPLGVANASPELDRLATALGDGYARIVREGKR